VTLTTDNIAFIFLLLEFSVKFTGRLLIDRSTGNRLIE